MKKQLIAIGLALPAATGLIAANQEAIAAPRVETSPAARVTAAGGTRHIIIVIENYKIAFDASSAMQDKSAADLAQTLDR
jgi:hypothetical protein